MKYLIISMLIIVSTAVAFAAETADIGSIKTVTGASVVIRQTETIPASVGLRLTNKDVLQTEKNGSLGVIMRDNSLLSIGPETRLELSSFEFEPQEKKMGFVSRLTRGSLVYLTGLMARLKKDSVKFETPSAVVGIRGTKIAIKAE